MLLKSVFKIPLFRVHTSLHMFWAICWDRLRVLAEMWPELSLSVRKRRVKSANDCPTLLDEVWNWPHCPHTLLFFNMPSIWLTGNVPYMSAGNRGDHCSGLLCLTALQIISALHKIKGVYVSCVQTLEFGNL